MNLKIFTTLFPSLLFINHTFAQKTKTVKIEHKDLKYNEEYQVLKDHPEIKHGKYRSYRYKNFLVTEGFYKQGLKDSAWTDFYDGKIISQGNYMLDQKTGQWINYWYNSGILSKGNYTNGKKSGIWEYFDKDNQLFQKYDFDNNKLLFYTEETLNKKQFEFSIKNDSGIYKVIVERPPVYQGGENAQFSVISKNIRYPEAALDNGIDGTVVVSFWIGTDGVAFDHVIKVNPGYGLGEEAMRVVLLLKDNWIPAIYNDQPVITQIDMPVKFKISQ